MRLVFLTILIIFAYPASIMAEQIRVRSGEHSYFSRLVLQFPTVVAWTLNRSGSDYVFSAPNSGHQFNTTTIFDLIPKTRILSVKAQDEILRITVSQGVHADAFELRPGRIVIDIKDGQAKDGSPFELPPDSPLQQPQTKAEKKQPARENGAAPVPTKTTPKDPVSRNINLNEVFHPAWKARQNQPKDHEEALPPFDHMKLAPTKKKLTEQIGRAMSQGLLETNMATIPNADSYKETSDPKESISSFSHINITSPIEPNVSQKPTQPAPSGTTSCLTDEDVAITSWGTDSPDMSYIGHLRNNAVGEFDRHDSKGIQNLAQYYLFLTFGAEARAAIHHTPVDNQAILQTMADIMEMGYSSAPNPFDQQFRCEGDVAFWSVMAKPTLNDWEDYKTSSILATFSALPLHIRRHLGPKLSERFFAIGDSASASAIQNAISRASGDHGEAFALLEAKIKLSNGDTEEAYDILETLIEKDGSEAANATISLIKAKSKTKEPTPPRIINNASVLSVEHHDGPLEQPLKDAEMLANIYSGDANKTLKRAIKLLSEPSDQANTPQIITLALSEITENSPDLEFLRAVVPHVTELSESALPNAVRLKVSERLSQLGFSEEAIEMMSSHSDSETSEMNILFAQDLVKLGNLNGALSYIENSTSNTSEETRKLEADILFRQGKPSLALEKLNDMGEMSQKDAYALLSGDWQILKKSNVSELSKFASIAEQNPTSLDTFTSTVALTETLVEASRETRRTLEGVLQFNF